MGIALGIGTGPMERQPSRSQASEKEAGEKRVAEKWLRRSDSQKLTPLTLLAILGKNAWATLQLSTVGMGSACKQKGLKDFLHSTVGNDREGQL